MGLGFQSLVRLAGIEPTTLGFGGPKPYVSTEGLKSSD